MDVVTDASAIEGRVVRPEDHQLPEFSVGRLQRPRDEVGGLLVSLADAALGFCACHVEIAKRNVAKVMYLRHLRQYPLYHDFGSAVGVDGGKGRGFLDGDFLGLAIDGGRRGIDEVADVVVPENVQEREGIGDVVPVVFQGLPHRLLHLDEGGKVNDGAGAKLLYGAVKTSASAKSPFTSRPCKTALSCPVERLS